jgi:hypothetical protein
MYTVTLHLQTCLLACYFHASAHPRIHALNPLAFLNHTAELASQGEDADA